MKKKPSSAAAEDKKRKEIIFPPRRKIKNVKILFVRRGGRIKNTLEQDKRILSISPKGTTV